ncbi:MAG TPA: HAD family hydrolase [Methylophaga aminisulfidivorans]|jgi:phosphoglycolate phosphatase-like HAD superfamily hydrolase|uniref:HAD family hydrolase n=1 Tax=Methylophaga TaxID=40222 RepID=UPI00176277CA|nr:MULTISPECIES: HAD family hydrolase [Methylophaga]HIC46085.1 HAD family hydrolase [Methylophaga sp.]HIM38940.1 HAD family hydrolase [Methylophaga aminisulfidivorans]
MTNKLYALDFDGVICDSAIETGIAGWKVALKVWADMPTEMPDDLLEKFRQVRPVMETGYEAVLIMRLLYEGMSADTLMSAFHHQIEALMIRDDMFVDELKEVFGSTRDEWIRDDFDSWIAMNPLFEGIAEKLRTIPTDNLVIITTKQERFVDHILKANQISLPIAQVYGLDRNMSKQQVLSDLHAEKPDMEIVFIEDRLPALINVITEDGLDDIKLYLASWGYNTASDKESANNIDRISVIQLSDMAQL